MPSLTSSVRNAYLVLLCALLWGSAGCSEVDHCKKGDLRCLGGQCDNRRCDFDLVCGQRLTGEELCGRRLRSGRFDFGGDQSEDALPVKPVNPNCKCEAPYVCSADTGECVNYCEPVSVVPRSGTPPEVIFCEHEDGQPPFTFQEICKRQCQLSCQRWSQFCGVTCAADFCDSQQMQNQCAARCPEADGNREVCLTRACNEVRDQTCASVICPDTGLGGSCQNLSCRNTCGIGTSAGYVGDGECDDGDLYGAVTAACAWGTDCVDCGPRAGTAPTPQTHGGLCAFHTGCLGYSPNIAANRAWCLLLNDVQPGLSRCVPDCSQGKTCPQGYECVSVMDDEGTPIVDVTGEIAGQACAPTMCGG